MTNTILIKHAKAWKEQVPTSWKPELKKPQPKKPAADTFLQLWGIDASVPKGAIITHEEWIVQRLRHAVDILHESVEIDPSRRGGVPVLKGTRVAVAQILAEIADDAKVSEIADDLDLNEETIVKFLEGIAIHLDRPFYR